MNKIYQVIISETFDGIIKNDVNVFKTRELAEEFYRIKVDEAKEYASQQVESDKLAMKEDKSKQSFDTYMKGSAFTFEIQIKVEEKPILEEVEKPFDKLFRELKKEYNENSEVCMGEFLADRTVTCSVEDAFNLYVRLMEWAEDDKFFRVNKDEKEVVEYGKEEIRYAKAERLLKYIFGDEDEPEEEENRKDEEYTILPGIFTVNEDGKKVRFTKSNVILEKGKQLCTEQMIKTGEDGSKNNFKDLFTFEEAQELAKKNRLSLLSETEWGYLFKNATIKNSEGNLLHRIDNINCLVLVPDDYNGDDVADSYTLEEWREAEKYGLVALPCAGGIFIQDPDMNENYETYEEFGYYWSSTLLKKGYAISADFSNLNAHVSFDEIINKFSVRLVKTVN